MLPAITGGRIRSDKGRRWLSRSSIHAAETPSEVFGRTLDAAGLPAVAEGLAALRLWGQTGDRPNVWMAAAEPIHMEAMLDHIRLRALVGKQSTRADLRAIFDLLQSALGDDSRYAFARVGGYGYLRSDDAIATAEVSALAIDGMAPDEFMPSGEPAAEYHKLTSELQLCLHDHEVNRDRVRRDLLPVNSIWLWGGGRADEKKVLPMPLLIGDDPLFKGYWESCTGVVEPWPGNFEQCLELATEDLVIVTPASHEDRLGAYLAELRALLGAGRLKRLLLLSRDGLTIEVGRFDAFRIWRGTHELL